MSCFDIGFEVGSIYGSLRPCESYECYLYVLKTVVQSGTRKAVFGAMFDSTYRLVCKRWFRVSERGSYFMALGTNVIFCSNMIFFKNDACYPPDDVLNYFRKAPSGVCA